MGGREGPLQPAQLTFVIAPTASLAGGVQISARILETGLHKMETLGFDVRRVVSAMGTAPLPPVAKNDLRAIGRTNDCILYGGQARYTVRAGDAELAELAAQVPASASRDYGTPFYEIFQRYEGDFYKIDPLLFSPAEVWLTSTETGRTFHAGRLNPEVLNASLYNPLPTQEHSMRRSPMLAGSLPSSRRPAASRRQARRDAADRTPRRPPPRRTGRPAGDRDGHLQPRPRTPRRSRSTTGRPICRW